MTRLARVRDTDACHGEEVYVRYASPLFYGMIPATIRTKYGND